MRGQIRVPPFVIAAALLGLIVLLATLQYQWVGQISDAERDRMRASLGTRTSEFAQEFDGEITRAYLLFQVEPPQPGEAPQQRVAARYDRWQATSRYPRMIRDLYVVEVPHDGPTKVQGFDPATRTLAPAEWPPALAERGRQLAARTSTDSPGGAFFVRALASPVWEEVPALAVPAPLWTTQHGDSVEMHVVAPAMAYTILVLDRGYIVGEMIPALAQKHFRGTGDGFDYKLAVVSTTSQGVIYHSADDFQPKPDASADGSAGLLQLRMQDFGSIVSEVRRFATTVIATSPQGSGGGKQTTTTQQFVGMAPGAGRLTLRESAPLSIVVQQGAPRAAAAGGVNARLVATVVPSWRLLVKHPSGSLEAAVNAARRRNLIVSSSILAVLGASVALLMLSTRRAQELARRQMEFVAVVSHELRTPLAVIRSAGENLADGVVRDDDQIRRYGELVKNEGRRLTEMVEQILEFAGIQSGQRGFALRPVGVLALLEDVVGSSAALIDAARIEIDWNVPPTLPPVLGDEPALRRVFQNLIGNAVKYGAAAGWIGLRAESTGREVRVTVADRGIGISAADQAHIFEPFYRAPAVVDAQIQGAGLGLSLVERIVEAHGGRIAVRSAPAEGSEFTVSLPAATEEPVSRATLAGAPVASPHS